ncbi:MAG: helix-turn-helix transcriptional regulator [Lachnospiraceae bacterium]|jgi:DNA-binding HxlR family transcriptional regulator|nr:helix-turn-helix transcriptional regulator [Lachnospiraceae bacterium]MCR4656785.1 helix-turn-helix transcriptional regulator [Lachnospiraceae bacterium]
MSKKEPLCETVGGEGCGLKKVINIVGGKWKIMILCVIDRDEVVRYGDLRRSIYGITNTMLAQSLKDMESDGLVIRKQYDEMPVRVEYSLSEKAKSLIPILLELKRWGESNL